MITLIILACLIEDPNKCKTFKVNYEENVTMKQCQTHSMYDLVKCIQDHPNYKIVRFKCVDSTQEGQDI